MGERDEHSRKCSTRLALLLMQRTPGYNGLFERESHISVILFRYCQSDQTFKPMYAPRTYFLARHVDAIRNIPKSDESYEFSHLLKFICPNAIIPRHEYALGSRLGSQCQREKPFLKHEHYKARSLKTFIVQLFCRHFSCSA